MNVLWYSAQNHCSSCCQTRHRWRQFWGCCHHTTATARRRMGRGMETLSMAPLFLTLFSRWAQWRRHQKPERKGSQGKWTWLPNVLSAMGRLLRIRYFIFREGCMLAEYGWWYPFLMLYHDHLSTIPINVQSCSIMEQYAVTPAGLSSEGASLGAMSASGEMTSVRWVLECCHS